MKVSIRSRLLVSASIVLVAFLGITGAALNRGYHDSVETAVHGRLQAHVYTLLAAAELDDHDRLSLPSELPEPRFSAPDSGLVAAVRDNQGKYIWRSKSLLGQKPVFPSMKKTGQWSYGLTESEQHRFVYAGFVASWAGKNNGLYQYQFVVAEDYAITQAQLDRFSRTLWIWLGAAGVLLLAVQGTILGWSLSPLRQAENEIEEIESGQRKRLSSNYPVELQQLTARLNTLVENSDKHLQRYRDSLGNLAHSLKTPLAVLRNAIESVSTGREFHDTANEQMQRMVDIINHQLQRAATAGRNVLAEPVLVEPQLRKIVNALKKVYSDKSVNCELHHTGNPVFGGDEGDLFELAGNLLDNAFKWCRHRVRVSVSNKIGNEPPRLELVVEDDGPGIPANKRDLVLGRGNRTDPDIAGHGLGLDMVRETVTIYHGTLEIQDSDLGGSKIIVTI